MKTDKNKIETQNPKLGVSDVRNNILKRIGEHTVDIIKYEKLYRDTKNEMYIDYAKNYSIRRSELKSVLQYCFFGNLGIIDDEMEHFILDDLNIQRIRNAL